MQSELDIIPFNQWFNNQPKGTIVMAGPCSAESLEQIITTAKNIEHLEKVRIFRAGIWKPRTRPNAFEGVGKTGLSWLKEVKKQTRLLTATEVATPQHLEECLKEPDSIDIIWIGARTTSNPFSIQALADVIKGVDIPVIVKNPPNPDISLWLGALERFNKAGIKKLGAIHRGFFPFENNQLRNIPKWDIPIELKSRFPNLTILCDPSHMAGKREYILSIAQKAIDINMDGLMIETHFQPEKALSDREQQVTPKELEILLNKIHYRITTIANMLATDELEAYREQIDSIDYQILELLAKRMKIVDEIAKYKIKKNLSIIQLRRWKNIISSRTEFGQKLGLDREFIKTILTIVHKESVIRQAEILKKNEFQ